MRIAFFGSSILSAYWNGAATYYRGLLRALADLGHEITFYEPDAFGRQQNRDVDQLPFVRSVVYSAANVDGLEACLTKASQSDVIVKASGVGVFDELLEARVAALASQCITIFWDVDAPATLDRVLSNGDDPFRACIPKYSAICTYGGGQRVVDAYVSLGARSCTPIYNAVDMATHFRVLAQCEFESLLAFQGNRLPDREARMDEFFFGVAAQIPDGRFLLGGNGWLDKQMTANIKVVGHVSTELHNAFNSSPRFVLNVNRNSMADYGFSPPTRVFEAAAAGACIITDEWAGIEMFLQPGSEILVAKRGSDVTGLLRSVEPSQARNIAEAGQRRILAQHTYAQRALEVDALLRELLVYA